MYLNMTEKIEDFLNYSKIKGGEIIVANMYDIIYSTSKYAPKDFHNFIKDKICKINFKESDTLEKYKKNNINNFDNKQLIFPIMINQFPQGLLIFNKNKGTINTNDFNELKSILNVISFLFIYAKGIHIKDFNYLNDSFFDTAKNSSLKLATDSKNLMNKNKNYLKIKELFNIKVDMLKNKLCEEDIILLKEILDLSEELQSYNYTYLLFLTRLKEKNR